VVPERTDDTTPAWPRRPNPHLAASAIKSSVRVRLPRRTSRRYGCTGRAESSTRRQGRTNRERDQRPATRHDRATYSRMFDPAILAGDPH